jgi:hypothetical protein
MGHAIRRKYLVDGHVGVFLVCCGVVWCGVVWCGVVC